MHTNPDAAQMIGRNAIQRAVQRRLAKCYPSPPTSPEIVFPDKWKHLVGDLSQPEFLLIQQTFPDENHNSQTILVFGLMSAFQALCESESWYVDGTFTVCPNPFVQLFTIHYIC